MFISRKFWLSAVAAVLVMGASGLAQATPILYTHDNSGNLGTVDVATGTATVIGSMGVVMTDIAFNPLGDLFGLSFSALYSIDVTTAAPTLISAHGIPGGNALVFGDDGTLYGAGFQSTSLYTLDPTNGATTTYGNMGYASAGDLAFNGGDFFLASTTNQLINVDLSSSGAGTAVGAFGFSDVYGLATGDDGILYGMSGTNVFSVNTSTGVGTLVSNYGGQGLGGAYGSSFYTEAGATVPEPPSLALAGLGLAGLLFWRRRCRVAA